MPRLRSAIGTPKGVSHAKPFGYAKAKITPRVLKGEDESPS